MSDVQRYDLMLHPVAGRHMGTSKAGEWVKAADYDALLTENDQLRTKLAESAVFAPPAAGVPEVEELKRLAALVPPLPWHVDKFNQDSETFSKVLGGAPAFKPAYLEPVHLLVTQNELGWPLADFIAAAVNAVPALLAAPTPPAAGVPEGWQLVPVEPTPAMLAAAGEYHGSAAYADAMRADSETDAECYRAMLAAAPIPPASEQQWVGGDADPLFTK